MNVTFLKWGAGSLALLVSAAGATTTVLAQDPSSSQSSPAPSAPAAAAEKKTDPSIPERKENQQDRIANGVKSGQLTPGETANLEKKEAAINKETSADRAANGGKLTSAEKAQVNKQQNQVSKQIYTDKHNANTAHYGNNKVGQRRENQQDRIAQGIKSGQLTPSETAKLEKQQQGINKQVASDRKANGGTLNAAQKKQVNKEQNQASRNIYKKKHNAATQPNAKPKP
jgi:hypothetical protein